MSDIHTEENSTTSRELPSQQIKLYVEMVDPISPQTNYVECYPQFPVVMREQGINIFLLASSLKQRGFQLEGKTISYYSQEGRMYINCGMDPVHPDYYIPSDEVEGVLRIKCTTTGISLIHMVMSEEMNEAVNKMKENEINLDNPNEIRETKLCRRTKERRIGFIIDKVSKWREFYNGVNVNGQVARSTLEEAAKKVGISKKSLDDYLLQVRYGRKYGFNFNEHRNDKVGILRAFVKKHNQCQKKKRVKVEN